MKIYRILGAGMAALTLLAASYSAQAADIPRPVYKGVRSVVAYYNWTAKVEYLYVDLGKFDCSTACGALVDNVSFQTNIVRAGLNYKFSGPIVSRF